MSVRSSPMYCRTCHYDLRASQRACRCPTCGAEFHPLDPLSYMDELPPAKAWVQSLTRLVWIVIIGTAAAAVVQFFAAAATSGH